MHQPAEQLVGRAAELATLDESLDELERGRSGVLEVVGEPGIGKTRLLAELGARADRRGRLVLSGSASELEDDVPFWVFVDALDEYVQGLDPRRLDALGDDVRGELATVLPSVSADRPPSGAAAERYRTHRAVRALLEELARPKSLVLLLDDLHWADAASIDLLGALLRRPPAGGVGPMTAQRPTGERPVQRCSRTGGSPNWGNSAASNVVTSATFPPSTRMTSNLNARNSVSPGARR
jgi:predicted ATPase